MRETMSGKSSADAVVAGVFPGCWDAGPAVAMFAGPIVAMFVSTPTKLGVLVTLMFLLLFGSRSSQFDRVVATSPKPVAGGCANG